MLFGTAAAVAVALMTVPVGRWLTGSSAARAYFGAAVLFAVIGTIILALVGATYREAVRPHRPQPRDLKHIVLSLARNRGFVTLNAAMMAMIVAITILSKSVLYYFKYLLNSPDAGQLALASMGLVSGVAIPLWMLLGRCVGLRALWLIAAGLGMAGLIIFSIVRFDGAPTMQLFLVGMQVMSVGLYGFFAAFAISLAAFSVLGYVLAGNQAAARAATAYLDRNLPFLRVEDISNARTTVAVVSLVGPGGSGKSKLALRTAWHAAPQFADTVAFVPLIFLALSCVAMAFNPLGRERRRLGREVEGAADPVALG